ncbi:MAG TPA: MtrB/PioB family outer membrane beta-barrel protein, partial [Rhodocyclaceae bacterium]|nr:MtrB/PioB family outer membrane beta-barrel protein [Rhodocyclaceae bacterium]
PWDNRQFVYGLSGDYRIDKTSSFNGAYERERINRSNREVDTTWEDKLKLGYTNRAVADGTVRLSYEYDHKRGSGYTPLAQYLGYGGEAFYNLGLTPVTVAGAGQSTLANGVVYTTATGAVVTTALANALVARAYTMRKFDVADRNQNILNGRLNYALRPDLDLAASYQWKGAKYPNSGEGRDWSRDQTLNFDLGYQPSPERIVHGYYSRQDSRMSQNDVQNGGQTVVAGLLGPAYACNLGVVTPWGTITAANAASICGDPSHNISFDPYKQYSVESHNTNDVLGFGFRQAFARNTLDVNFLVSRSKTAIGYSYVDPNAVGETTAVSAALMGVAGSGMPDITYSTYQINGNLLIPVDKQMSVRLLGSFEYGKIVDWHYPDNLTNNLILGTGNAASALQMDAGPQSYHVTTVGIMLLYKM